MSEPVTEMQEPVVEIKPEPVKPDVPFRSIMDTKTGEVTYIPFTEEELEELEANKVLIEQERLAIRRKFEAHAELEALDKVVSRAREDNHDDGIKLLEGDMLAAVERKRELRLIINGAE